ncbi:MAG: zinc ribbon domain-containing protein [Desulfobacterales bacterium]|jgi:putative FmdB family regulatory protein
MPIYEYKCKVCGAISEFLTGAADKGPFVCKKCGSLDMQRIMSAASILSQSSKRQPGHSCCGREERCDTPPCGDGGDCRRI